ncbi:hypothetical protein [Microbacterium sp. No. 7]|uniref:hypothetical protein n=1 Tax=Microbacterium sp. No. 7 TaxID=1714373 RepID=UPI0006ED2F64|nr:hypothetical protein [Microbacterium sp. No. 7]ALJ21067.1 hypothetical protein AOA12_14620 [Microbacterium sp. No. 7]
MFGRKSLDALNAQRQQIDARIEAHPLSAEEVRQAHAIIEARGDKDNAAIECELSANGLPSLEELGRIQVESTASWWRLHRERAKIAKRIEKLTSR